MSALPVRVVLVPGLGLDARSLTSVQERVAGTVVLPPGMGLPGPVPPLEALTARLLEVSGEGPLVGHSQSCQVVAVVVAATVRQVPG